MAIGEGTILNLGCMVAATERIEIGSHCMFANYCFVADADHRFDDRDLPVTWQGMQPKGPVTIGDNCWFGTNCVVTGGVTIGERTVVGANSVVTQRPAAGSDRGRRAGEGAAGDRVQDRASERYRPADGEVCVSEPLGHRRTGLRHLHHHRALPGRSSKSTSTNCCQVPVCRWPFFGPARSRTAR